MEDIIMNEEIEEVINTEVETHEEPETGSDGSVVAKVAIGLVAVGAAAVAAWKNKDKLVAWNDERKIKKLEKKGYVIQKKVEDEAEDVPVQDDSEVVEEAE